MVISVGVFGDVASAGRKGFYDLSVQVNIVQYQTTAQRGRLCSTGWNSTSTITGLEALQHEKSTQPPRQAGGCTSR